MKHYMSIDKPKKKKKGSSSSSKKKQDRVESRTREEEEQDNSDDNDILKEKIVKVAVPRTAAETAFERKQKERQKDRISKLAQKSHKEKVQVRTLMILYSFIFNNIIGIQSISFRAK